MVNAKGGVLHTFRKAMGAEFHLSSIDVLLRDTCTPGATTIQIFNIRASTQRTPGSAAQEESSGFSTGLIVGLIFIVAIILLAIFVLIFICLQRKRPAYKKKSSNGEYAAKGHPVVFPDEMAQEDETNGATAGVTAPMLVTHEHPPLNPPQTSTTTENPLYKPPTDSTASPQRAAIGQRLPPPYIAP